ncbi:uncharacterized protein LOC122075652 [Macadamia integrifolia]|uniref:uncharacterized protein LOC122075652 n=1 Tax=Macadamia integrifolia TaxID=60698 RepID=UPI001C4E7C13|nr:uncharacterized protein LOC122075652 [Macadamia integrifolia]
MMLGVSLPSRSWNFRPENWGQRALSLIGNLFFTVFVFGVLIFTIIAATYQPEDPLFHPSTKINNFLESVSNATFESDETVLKTGEDFMPSNQTAFATFINITDVPVAIENPLDSDCKGESDKPIDCTDREIFNLLMKASIEHFTDVHFYRFGKPVHGSNESTCDMAWRFRPNHGKTVAFYKDYRRYVISRSGNCNYTVIGIGDYHSGVNAKRRKNNQIEGFEKRPMNVAEIQTSLPVVGEEINDSLPMVESESSFSRGKYLIYSGGGERCKSMSHYLWGLLCALGEARYLNRTMVMDLTICLNSMHTSSHQNEEGKDFRFYFDFEHLKNSASVMEQNQFWSDWGKWQIKDGLRLLLVEDYSVTPMKLAKIQDTVIMRKFGNVKPDNYWYRVCEGETESVIQRPWDLAWKSRRLMAIATEIASRLDWDFDSVHVVRGEKAKNKELWPNLAADTSPEALISSLKEKIDNGRKVFIATNEPNTSFFDPLKDKYSIHFLNDYKDLWDENSEWYAETKKLNNGVPVEFDGYMRVSVDTEVFLRGKTQIETFNDLTGDCKDGINTCRAST